MKFQAHVPGASRKITESCARAGETGPSSGDDDVVFPGGQVSESPVLRSTRHSRGNQEFIDELRTKADELERLFAEQKLQMSGDQFSSRWKSTDFDSHAVPPRVPKKQIMTQAMRGLSGGAEFGTSPSMKMVGYQDDYADTYSQDTSVNRRGKFYNEYMRRRDAKLRQGGYNRALMEAKLKDMHADLEMNISELTAKFSRSMEEPHTKSGARSRIEKLRSFNIRSSMRMDEYTRALFCGEAESYPDGQSEASSGVGSSRSSATKKHFSTIQDRSSSKPQTTTVPVPRPSLKPSNSISGRQRPQSESPFVRSLPVVPSFSNMKKENKNPAPGHTRTLPRSQDRSFTRIKSTGEEIKVGCAKEKKTRESWVTRKRSSAPLESKNLSAWNSNGAILESVRFDEECVHPSLNEELVRSADSEAFPCNSNSLTYDDFGASALKAAAMANTTEDEEITTKEGRYHAPVDDEISGSSNGDSIGSHYSDLMSVSMLPRYHQQDLSEIAASVDSLVSSSISWSSQPMVHAGIGLARTRKKWGNAQKPNLADDSSQDESPKDAKKGFWLLKFGRSQVAESSVNRVSTLIMDGDKAIEDRCGPPPVGSLEHLKQPVTGISQDHSSSSSINASDFFQEQVQALNRSIPAPPEEFKLRDDQQSLSGSPLKAPRSFFSLSSFRNKGRDLKVYH